MTLSPEKMQGVYAIQRSMFDKFRNVPAEGKLIEYLGSEFIVYPGVFWPHEDSKALVRNYVINPGEDVLDVCTGCGVIAIYSALKGARKVVALDINPDAVRATRENAMRCWREHIVEARVSDVYSALRPGERFDVVTMNSPFTDHAEETKELVEKTIWDQDLHVQKYFFAGLNNVLKPTKDARAYVAQSNFGAIENLMTLANSSGFNIREIGRKLVDDLRTFYAFELKRKDGTI